MPDGHTARLARWSQWYGPARFGLFCHWGQRTGGGDSSSHPWGGKPFKYPTIAAFERAAGDPRRVARNMVNLAISAGARYLTFTVYHSCDRFAVMYPTRVPGFRVKTTRDYLGALVAECHRRRIKLLLYVPECAWEHTETAGGPWVDPEYIGDRQSVPLLFNLVRELVHLHGPRIAGFWLDGYYRAAGHDFADLVHGLLPHAIVVHNNDTALSRGSVDVSAIECTTTPCDPPYCRPSGLVKPHPEWGVLPPGRDFVEDIPTCNAWFHSDEAAHDRTVREGPYATDLPFLVRQMVSSLGQRRRWNFALGLGPRVDGTAPPRLRPMLRHVGRFLRWAGEAIYNTVGGDGSALRPGWWNSGAFGSITVSQADPAVHYVHVTTPPTADRLRVPIERGTVRSVVELRSGRPVAFLQRGSLDLLHGEWVDVQRVGDQVFTVVIDGADRS